MTCNCQPGNLYRGGLPTWGFPASTNQEAICAYNLLGNSTDPCYSGCSGFPIPCYGYALNIATPNAWTYPGLRNLTATPDVNNCTQLIAQTVADGSIFNGKTEPTALDSDQHVFVGYASNVLDTDENGEYHYARKDTDTNTWSSKNGENLPTHLDTKGDVITDPTKANFVLGGLGLEFCGYFITSNVAVCPSASDCVKGYQSSGNVPTGGCGYIACGSQHCTSSQTCVVGRCVDN